MTLDDKGRCCGRKPLTYKRPYAHKFCCRCCREFDMRGEQRENWAWTNASGDWFCTSETIRKRLESQDSSH